MLAIGLCGAVADKADFLNQFAPLWSGLGAGAIALLMATSPRRKAAALLGLALVAGAALLEGPELAARARPGWAAAPAEVRIVQFNVWKQNRAPALAADWVASQHADFVVLQEAAVVGAQVAERLARQYPFVVSCRGRKPCSTLILSKIAPVASAGLATGDAEDRKALSAAWARYDLEGRSITIVAAHLARPWPWGRQEKDRRLLLSAVRRLAGRNLILVGDFNTTPWTFAGRRQDAAFGMRRITRALFTWPAYVTTRYGTVQAIPFMPIDQAYVRPGLLPVAVRRGPRLGSDHRPVVIDLAWAPFSDSRPPPPQPR
jgi:endonuclease/exonuclease/phosphatase (EEP) superfamily protein YafD